MKAASRSEHGCWPMCRDCRLERDRAYFAARPHLGWESTYRTRMRRLGLTPVVESFTKAQVVAEYGDACAYCGDAFEQLDHFEPLANGGAHTLANVRPSCARCNRRKSNGTIQEGDA